MRIFGRPVRELWLAANWFKFPRAQPAAGMMAVRRHHVSVLKTHLGGNTWQVYDTNSGGRKTRIHARSIAGYTIVSPREGGGVRYPPGYGYANRQDWQRKTMVAVELLAPLVEVGLADIGNKWQWLTLEGRGQMRKRQMPVLLLWAVPAVVVLGGAGYFILHAVH